MLSAVESDKAEVEQSIAAAIIDYEELQGLLVRQSLLEETLRQTTDRWLYLNDLADRIAQEKSI